MASFISQMLGDAARSGDFGIGDFVYIGSGTIPVKLLATAHSYRRDKATGRTVVKVRRWVVQSHTGRIARVAENLFNGLSLP